MYFEEKRHLTAPHFAKVTKLERQILDALANFYREGVELGDFRDIEPSVAVLGILGMCFWLTKWYQPKGRLTANADLRPAEYDTAGGLSPHSRRDSLSFSYSPACRADPAHAEP